MAQELKPLLIISQTGYYITKRLAEEAERIGLPVHIIEAKVLADPHKAFDANDYSGLYVRHVHPFYEEVLALARRFKQAGKTVVDDITLDNLETSKWPMYQRLEKAGVSIPKTQLLSTVGAMSYPCVLKWVYGSQAKHAFLIRSRGDLERVVSRRPKQEWMVQEFIRSDWEYKVICVGYKSLPVVVRYKIRPRGFKVNIAEYEVLDVRTQDAPLQKIIQVAEKACRVLHRQLSKVDILIRNGEPVVLEANRWPLLFTIEPISGMNIAGEFVRYLREKI